MHASHVQGVVLYKDFDEKQNNLKDNLTADSIKAFVNDYRFPLVVPFSDANVPRIFQVDLPIESFLLIFIFLCILIVEPTWPVVDSVHGGALP